MREILFRGKRIDNDEWVEGHYGAYMLMSGESIPAISIPKKETICGSICYDVEVSTVGQLTGLPDKNGKKIFEDDVVRVKYSIRCREDSLRIVTRGIDFIATVIFVKCRFCLEKANGEVCEMPLNSENVEVIGNIHDNPELLEVEE